ncbi:hypothetical protein ANN_07973 [Periplaneta americana]|uniref:Thyroglobulin type-1 domain-containing protein n=1 Tax=Periplaneta americana TaxID=6978 RepID=A0ABQ8T2C2_PERAM|nr:hypothetical protein ANN_07973 [Periplaneta americana]
MPGYSCKEDPKDKKYKCKLDDGKALSGYDSWTPRCIGTDYAPIQCKGDKPTGKCFCVDVNGKRIFGEALWSEASNMTCACSRRVEELRANGRLDVTLHCDTQGNFEELQCDNGVCWCAEERTGVPKSRVLPEGMMKTLPCYNATLVGSKYLRQCESQQVAQARVIREMAAHKANNPNFPYTNCDLDGSYGAVQQDTNTYVQMNTTAKLRSCLFVHCECNVLLTGQAYTNFLENTIPHVLEDTPLINRQHIHFLHDGAPAHFSRTARRYLDRRFPDRWIGRGGPIAWPPRSPDLNPHDFYLWGHLKSLVYSSLVPDLESLRNRIVACSEDTRNTPGVWDRVRRFYCAWKDKTRIEGYSAEYADFPKMNCRCARDKKIYGDSVMQKCSGSGNYESKQYTNNGTVYCVDEDGFLDNTACT